MLYVTIIQRDSNKRVSLEHKANTPNASQTVKTSAVETKVEMKVEDDYNSRKSTPKEYDRTEIVKTPVEKKTEEKRENQFNFQTKISNEKIQPIEIGPKSPAVGDAGKSANSAVAIYEYVANDSDEISFEVDDLITQIEKIDEGWWIGCNKHGIKGMFPSNYVQMNESEEQVRLDICYYGCVDAWFCFRWVWIIGRM